DILTFASDQFPPVNAFWPVTEPAVIRALAAEAYLLGLGPEFIERTSKYNTIIVSEDQNDVSIAFGAIQPFEKEPVHGETLIVLRNVGLLFLADADDLAGGIGLLHKCSRRIQS